MTRSKFVTNYAQTNIQFFKQLRLAKYSASEISYIHTAYQFGLQIFTNRFCSSSKPFVSHLVGIASIIASVHVPIEVIAAGLLHAAYIDGEYGTDKKGITNAKREQVRSVVSVETEELIANYTVLKWDKITIPVICDRLDMLDYKERQVLLIRLAKELENYLDLGNLYSANSESHQEYIRSVLYQCVEMAHRLGFPTLAAALKCNFRDTCAAQIPAAIRTNRDSAFLLLPA